MKSDPNKQSVIEVADLSVGYNGKSVLEGVGFSVHEGEILSILGSSGCGKTTLLRTLTGLLPPREGSIRIAGEEIAPNRDEEALSRMRRQIGVLFQSGGLMDSLTVAENVALPIREFTDLPEEIISEVVKLKLDLVQLGQAGHLLPSEVSGGMNKRAALARAIALDPSLLLCDEPVSGLDPVTAREIDSLLLELNKYLGVTLVVITHEVASIENISHRCLMLDPEAKGIIASGTVQELEHDTRDRRVQAFFQRRLTSPKREESS